MKKKVEEVGGVVLNYIGAIRPVVVGAFVITVVVVVFGTTLITLF